MSEPTTTLQQLRRDLCDQLKMPFYERFPSGSTLTGTPTASVLYDSSLKQKNNAWKGDWVYMVDGDAAQEHRLITLFQSETEAIYPEYDFSTAPGAGDTYEITSIFSPAEIHNAINRAIQDSFPAFFDVIEDETLIVEEDQLEYDISGLGTSVWLVLKIWLERTGTGMTGIADSGGATTLTDASLAGALGDVDTNWKLSVYGGTGSGQVRDVSSVNDTTGEVTVTSAWTTNPDSTSKYRLWNPTKQEYTWKRLEAAQFDTDEYPSTLLLLRNYPDYYGLRMRIQYVGAPSTLSAEADTTVVPKEYILEMAQSILYGKLVPNTSRDRSRYAGLEEYHRLKAEQKKASRAFLVPDGTIWKDHDVSNMGAGVQEDDPLGFNY